MLFSKQNALTGLEEIKKELKEGSRVHHRDRSTSQMTVQKRPLSRDRLVFFCRLFGDKLFVILSGCVKKILL